MTNTTTGCGIEVPSTSIHDRINVKELSSKKQRICERDFFHLTLRKFQKIQSSSLDGKLISTLYTAKLTENYIVITNITIFF